MGRSPFSTGIIGIAILLATSACSTAAGVAPSAGPWQFSGAVFARDEQYVGEPVASAHLSITHDGEVRASTTTDTSGRYVFNGLETGRFKLTISAPGFVTLTPTLNLDRNMRADFGLKRQ